MIRHIVFTSVFVFLTHNLTSQSDTSYVLISRDWNLHDSLNYRITKIRKEFTNDQLLKDDSISYTINFNVIDTASSLYHIRWKRISELTQSIKGQGSLAYRLSLYNFPEVTYLTDIHGSFIGFTNWKELLRQAKKHVQKVKKPATSLEKQQSVITEYSKPFISFYLTPPGLRDIGLKELHAFHYLSGRKLDKSEPFLFDSLIYNPLLNSPVRIYGKLYVKDFNPESNTLVIVQEKNTDPEEIKNLLGRIFSSSNIPDSLMQLALEKSVMSMNEVRQFELLYDKGYPRLIEISKEDVVQVYDQKKQTIEKLKIELIQ